MKWFSPPLKATTFKQRDRLLAHAANWKSEAEDVNEIRNKIVHSVWFQQQRHLDLAGKTAAMTGLKIGIERSNKIVSGKTGLKYDIVSLSAVEISDFVKQIEKTTKALTKLKNITVSTAEAK